MGLPVTVGGGTSKIVAKMASRAAKPDGLKIVDPGGEAAFLHPLAAEELWGVGPSTARKLDRAMIRTVGDVARRTEAELIPIVGKAAARQLHAISNARDYRRVRSGRSRRSFGTQSAMDGRPRTPAELEAILVGLVDRVTGRMSRANRAGRTVVLRLRYRDFTKVSRSRTMHRSSATSATVLAAARSLLADAMPAIRTRGLTLLGIAVTNLDADQGHPTGAAARAASPPGRRPRSRRDQDAFRIGRGPARLVPKPPRPRDRLTRCRTLLLLSRRPRNRRRCSARGRSAELAARRGGSGCRPARAPAARS